MPKRARNAGAEQADGRLDVADAAKHKTARGKGESGEAGEAPPARTPPAHDERAEGVRSEDERRRKLKVHLARFVEYQPQIVTAMAYEDETQTLAVARGSGDIELWRTVAPRWHPVGTLTGSSSSQIRSVCWVRRDGELPRLFSGSLDGAITEWSLLSLGPVSVTDSQGGSVWCLAVSHSGERLAAACHDGGVRVFEAPEKVPGLASVDGVVFRQLLPRHPGVALSVAWGPGDRVLVTGDSHGVVRVWQLGKERSGAPPAVQTISVASNTGAGGMKKAALLWAVAAHADMTVWAADSKGNTHVIDARMGLVVKRFVAHHGSDVLALATHGLNDCFSAGVDGRVVHYRRVACVSANSPPAQMGGQWVQAGAARLHSHDIRCLCLAGQFYSVGGTDKKAADFESGKLVLKAHQSSSRVEPLNLRQLHHCLVSAGLDTQLCLYTYDLPEESVVGQALRAATRLPPWPLQSCVHVSAPIAQKVHELKTCEVRMLACHLQSMEVWRWKVTRRGSLAMAGGGPASAGLGLGRHAPVSVSADTHRQGADKDREWVEEPRYAVRIETAPDGGRVACGAVSADGAWIGCGLSKRFALYQLSDKPDGSVDVAKCVLPKSLQNTGVRALVFLHDSSCVAVAQTSGHIRVVNLESKQVIETMRVPEEEGSGLLTNASAAAKLKHSEEDADGEGGRVGPRGGVTRMCVSDDGSWLAAVSLGGEVRVWRLSLPARGLSAQGKEAQGKQQGKQPAPRHHAEPALPICVPALAGGVTAMRFRPQAHGPQAQTSAANHQDDRSRALPQQLVLVTAENKVYVFEVGKRKLTQLLQPEHKMLERDGVLARVSLRESKDSLRESKERDSMRESKDARKGGVCLASHAQDSQDLTAHPHHCSDITFNPRLPSSLILWGYVPSASPPDESILVRVSTTHIYTFTFIPSHVYSRPVYM
jgi:WD40 repeat protein